MARSMLHVPISLEVPPLELRFEPGPWRVVVINPHQDLAEVMRPCSKDEWAGSLIDAEGRAANLGAQFISIADANKLVEKLNNWRNAFQ